MRLVADRIVRHPRAAFGAWLALVAIMACQAPFVTGRLSQPTYTVSGTESQRALDLEKASFGPNIEFPILLSGPGELLSREGPVVASRLAHLRGISVLSPWDPGGAVLRPGPERAMLVAQVQTNPANALPEAGRIDRAVHAIVRSPLRASITGQAYIGKSLEDETLAATDRAELLALPILIVVLLLVFRTPVAAAIPALFGIATVAAAYGVISMLALTLPLEATALSLASMLGLALGVDYSLLLVARFREELGDRTGRAAAKEAASVAITTAGRTIAFAGGTLTLAMLVAVAVAPGSLLLSAIVGVVVVALLSVIGSAVAVPALLVLVGSGVNRWTIGRRSLRAHRFTNFATSMVLRRPLLTALAVVLPLAALAAPAFAVKPQTPGVNLLPASNHARADFDSISRAMGPGWAATFKIPVAVARGTIADPQHLAQLGDLQRSIARDRDVAAVIGPAELASRSRSLVQLPRQIASLEHSAKRARDQLGQLNGGLAGAAEAVTGLSQGLNQATAASTALANGSGDTHNASIQVETAIATAASATHRLERNLDAAQAGARRLAAGSAHAARGAHGLHEGAHATTMAVTGSYRALDALGRELQTGAGELTALKQPAQLAQQQLDTAFSALRAMTAGKQDPQYTAAVNAVTRADAALSGRDPVSGARLQDDYPGLPSALSKAAGAAREASTAVAQLRARATRLASGAGRLLRSTRKLEAGLRELARGNQAEAEGLTKIAATTSAGGTQLTRLRVGAGQLRDGVSQLHGGAAQLTSALVSGRSNMAPIVSGVGRIQQRTSGLRGAIPTSFGLAQLTRQSPGLFKSGNLLLAGVDGAPAAAQRSAASVLAVDHGGQGARLFVIPRTGANAEATGRLFDRLASRVRAFAHTTGMSAAVGGEAAVLIDYDRHVTAVLPVLIVALALVTWCALVVVVRALLLPLIAVALNLLTVGTAFGALVLLYQGAAPLGGPGYLDAIAVIGIFGIVFGLSIDYEVFLLGRMREEYRRSGSTEAAIHGGLLHTAGVITGAAAIMAGVFTAFALVPFVAIAEFGVGLTVAVLIDATLVRIILLPALTRLFGAAVWWLPRWITRLLPSEHLPAGAPAQLTFPHRSAS